MSDAIRTILDTYTAGSGAGALKVRTAFDLPQVPETEINVVSDSATCTLAAEALVRDGGLAIGRALVLSVGPARYAVYDPRHGAGEFGLLHIYDSSFVHKGSMTL